MSNHIVVCGLDTLGMRLVEELRRLGEVVVVVVDDAPEDHLTTVSRAGATIVRGVYRDEHTLLSSNIAGARALALVEQDDVGNLHAALTAQDLNDDLRIVARFFNESLGESAETLLRDCVALSASSIAAPLFVAAAMQQEQEQEQTIDVAGRALVVRQLTADPASARVLMPVARAGASGESALLPAGAETGDLALCDRVDAGENHETPEPTSHRGHTPTPRSWMVALQIAISVITDRRLRWLLAAILAIVATGVVVFTVFVGLSPIDALYFTITTVTTTGYGDISLLHQSPAIKIFGIALIVVGATVLALFYALIIDAFVGIRLARALGTVPAGTRDHVVVCGLGNVGSKVVALMVNRGLSVVAVERDEDSRSIATARRLGVPVVIADASLEESLRTARIEHARCLIALTNDDVTNLETGLNARHICPGIHVVLRLFDNDLAARVDRTFKMSVSRSVSALAAPAFAAALLERDVFAVIPVGHNVLVVAAVTIESGSELDGTSVASVDQPHLARPLCVQTADGSIDWDASRMDAGDSLIVIATRPALSAIVTRARSRSASPSGGHE